MAKMLSQNDRNLFESVIEEIRQLVEALKTIDISHDLSKERCLLTSGMQSSLESLHKIATELSADNIVLARQIASYENLISRRPPEGALENAPKAIESANQILAKLIVLSSRLG